MPEQSTILKSAGRVWSPTPAAWERLLRWLDSTGASQGQQYEAMRRRLIEYFERKNCLAPEDLADETFNRVMRWLEQEGKEYDPEPAKICYNTARFVFQESLRQPGRATEELSELAPALQPAEDPRALAGLTEEQAAHEQRLACLERCSQQLAPPDQQLIVRYYYGEQRIKLENRKALASELGLTPNALNIKTSRLREKLRTCVTTCVAA